MNKNDFQNLLKTINEAYDPHQDDRNFGIDFSKIKPWQHVAGGDIHDKPGGEEAWNAQQAMTKAAKDKQTAGQAARLPLPTEPMTDAWTDHVESNGFGLSPDAHKKAKELTHETRNAGWRDLPDALSSLASHLITSGVHKEHPHIKTILNDKDEAENDRYLTMQDQGD